MPSVSLREEVRSYLLAAPTLDALIEDRIYLGELPQRVLRAAKTRMAPTVLIETVPGGFKPSDWDENVGQVDVTCFAGDYNTVLAMDKLIYARLDDIVEPAGALISARPGGSPTDAPLTENGAPGTYRSYLVQYVDYD